MHSQTLYPIIVFWFAIHGFTRAVSDDDDYFIWQPKKLGVVGKLNMLVRHSGWRALNGVKILINKEVADPMPVILEALSSGNEPVEDQNVITRYNEIWTVLRCKYADVIHKIKVLIQTFVRVCKNEKMKYGKKTVEYSLQKYYSCFNSLLSKLHSISPRFKFMRDALDFMYEIGPQSGLKQGVNVGTQKLFEYTSTVGPTTSSNLSKLGINEVAVGIELKHISDFIVSLYNRHIYWFAHNHCIAASHEEGTIHRLKLDFEYKMSNQQLPEETTIVQYIIDEFDSYVSDIFDSCFYDLGFAYDVTGNVIIRNN